MRVSDFDFDLPPERIALRPASPRESARLLVVGDAGLQDRLVSDLPGEFRAGDVFVFNNTKVIPAALSGHRMVRLGTTPRIEALLHQRLDAARWTAFVKPAKKLRVGDRIDFSGLVATVEDKGEAGEVTLTFAKSGAELDTAIAAIGHVPLPPYIESRRPQDSEDRADYQTVYARHEGAVAAPTAGFHFTEKLLARLAEREITSLFVTLHVGAGTFLPVKAEDTRDHRMHSEWGEVPASVSDSLLKAKAEGRRIIAVGTTSMRLLEASSLMPFAGSTDIFITPGYRFQCVDGLITNFHLPRSTLFMLVCAFAGTARMKEAYAHAMEKGYRFYSYGDASLLWPKT